MQLIPTRTHGFLDYLFGLLLIVAPWLFGFANGGAAQWVAIVLGIVLIVYSLLTNYELGAVHLISMPIHLGLDVAGGVLLAISPWLLGFAGVIVWPHLVLGVVEIIVALITYHQPERTT